MKGLTGEWNDLKDWTAYLIDLLSRGKRDVTALKVLIVLALIVVPGGILLQSSGGVFHGVNAVLSPLSSLFNGLLSGPAPGNGTDDRTHTGVFDPNFKPTPYLWSGSTDKPLITQNDTPTPTSILFPDNGTSPTPTTGPAPTPGPTAAPTPVPQDHFTVHVKDGSGTGIANALVRIGSLSGSTDSSGNVGFTLSDGIAITLQVSKTGYDSNNILYTPTAGGTATVTLALTVIPQDLILVIVQDGSGPIDHAQVTIDSQNAFTNTSGKIDFTLDDGVAVTIQASAAGHNSNSISFTPTPGGIATVTLTLMPAPTASFTATTTSGDAPLLVLFTDTSNGNGCPVSSWQWNFGDGGISSSQNPGHTYLLAGTYTVTLIATSAAGSNTCTHTNYITITTPTPTPTRAPVADFSGTPVSIVAGQQVTFTDLSTNTPTSWSWTFGDGGTSAAQSPSHTYNTPGTYTVVLTATNAGGSDTATKTAYITVSTPPAPVAGFSASATSGTEPLTVTFTDGSSGAITSYDWDFGDGSGHSASQSPSHVYAAGTYTVTLTVTGPGGTDQKTTTITVAPAPAPVASFTADVHEGSAPLTVNFDGSSSQNAVSYSWDFGDGTGSGQTASHTYDNPGTYTVKLTIYNSVGAVSVATDVITVDP